MMKRRVIAASFVVIGLVWLVAMAWYSRTMGAIAEPVLALPLYIAVAFAPPAALISSAVVLFVRQSRVAGISCIVVSALLTCWLVPTWFSFAAGLFRTPEPLQSASTSADYIIAAILTVFIICVVAAVLTLIRSMRTI